MIISSYMSVPHLEQTYPFTLPDLPYPPDALEPYIDAQTMQIHHGKHHASYVDKLNTTLANQPQLHNLTLRELLSSVDSLPLEIRQSVINHGGGHFNHSLFWGIMSGKNKSQSATSLIDEINQTFGSLEVFKTEFKHTALAQFGSGWAWLTTDLKGKDLQVSSTTNQDSPLSHQRLPILGLDVWEHAYYLKYQNRRSDYIDAWWNVVDWGKVEKLLTHLTHPDNNNTL